MDGIKLVILGLAYAYLAGLFLIIRAVRSKNKAALKSSIASLAVAVLLTVGYFCINSSIFQILLYVYVFGVTYVSVLYKLYLSIRKKDTDWIKGNLALLGVIVVLTLAIFLL